MLSAWCARCNWPSACHTWGLSGGDTGFPAGIAHQLAASLVPRSCNPLSVPRPIVVCRCWICQWIVLLQQNISDIAPRLSDIIEAACRDFSCTLRRTGVTPADQECLRTVRYQYGSYPVCRKTTPGSVGCHSPPQSLSPADLRLQSHVPLLPFHCQHALADSSLPDSRLSWHTKGESIHSRHPTWMHRKLPQKQ